jgi:porin
MEFKQKRLSFALIILFLLLACSFVTAQESIWSSNRQRLLGDLGGARTRWEEKGFTWDLVYTGEVFMNTRGGINTSDSEEYRGDVSLFLTLDTGQAGWWQDGVFFIHLQEGHGQGITDEHAGDFQVVSNIDADDFKQVSEFWYLHSFFENRLWVKLGKQEANADFAFVDYGVEFINSSPGFSPTIPMPSYPDQDWGLVIGTAPNDWFSANLGIYQGRPNGGRSIGDTLDNLHGPMTILEPAFHYDLSGNPGHLRLGAWWHGDKFEELDDPGGTSENYGFYLTWDQQLWLENPGVDEQGIGLFAQYGWAPEDLNEAGQYFGLGMQWTGPVPRRDEDIAGLGVFSVDFSGEAGFEDDAETAIELFYSAPVLGWLSLKPDLQYIINPGGAGNDDALAVGLRLQANF